MQEVVKCVRVDLLRGVVPLGEVGTVPGACHLWWLGALLS